MKWQIIIAGILVAIAACFVAKRFGSETISRDELLANLQANPKHWASMTIEETTVITPFRVPDFKQEMEDLKQRLAHWRRHKPLQNVGYSYGLSGTPLDELVKYWREKYDWPKALIKLNSLPQFTTVIQGLKIHFIHATGDPKASKRVPLLLVHGWPGSVAEFYRAIPLLTKIGEDGTAFDIVAPSIPGFAFSEAATKPGLNPIAVAQIFHSLMNRLGYSKFVYQGGDWGSIIGAILSRIYPDSVIGYHSNFVLPPTVTTYDKLHLLAAKMAPTWFLDKEDVTKLDRLNLKLLLEESGYFHEQATKPDTIGVALSDSPVGLAAWIVEKFISASEHAEVKGDESGKGFSNEDLLTDVMLYWLTNHATSAARIYKETIQTKDEMDNWGNIPITVPTGVACYPREIMCSPKALLKNDRPRLVHYADIAHGGHFAAFEEPELFVQDVRKAVRAFFEAHESTQHQLKFHQEPAKEQNVVNTKQQQAKRQENVSPPSSEKKTTQKPSTTASKPSTSQPTKATTTTVKPSPSTTTVKPTPSPSSAAKPVSQKAATTTTPKPKPTTTTSSPPKTAEHTTVKPPSTTTVTKASTKSTPPSREQQAQTAATTAATTEKPATEQTTTPPPTKAEKQQSQKGSVKPSSGQPTVQTNKH